jgi:hypothetical protein
MEGDAWDRWGYMDGMGCEGYKGCMGWRDSWDRWGYMDGTGCKGHNGYKGCMRIHGWNEMQGIQAIQGRDEDTWMERDERDTRDARMHEDTYMDGRGMQGTQGMHEDTWMEWDAGDTRDA